MSKHRSITRKLSLAIAPWVVVITLLHSITSIRINLFALRETALLHTTTPNIINEMYWGVTYNWQNNATAVTHLDPSATDGEVMRSVIKSSLNGNGEQILLISQKHTDACMRRLSCRMLYTRAAFSLGRKDLIEFQVLDEDMWHALAGKGMPQVRTNEELASYQEYYEALLPLFPNKSELFHILGSINRTRGGWEKALPYFEQALALAPTNTRYQCNVGEALVYTDKKATEGLELCLNAISKSPDDLWLYEITGRSYAHHGRCDKAIELYEEAVLLFPNRTEPTIWLDNFHAGLVEQCTTSN